jgi:hypothetical protein
MKPEKINFPKHLISEEYRDITKLAIQHMQTILHSNTSSNVSVMTGASTDAYKVFNKITNVYNNMSRSNIKSNCVCVCGNDESIKFVMNFLPSVENRSQFVHALNEESHRPMNEELMQQYQGMMHAEIRTIHSPYQTKSIDKAMCLFCAVTFRMRGISGQYHTRRLQWYTFSPHVLKSIDNIRYVFGNTFANVWRVLERPNRILLLESCLYSLSLLTPCCPKCGRNEKVIPDHFQENKFYCYQCKNKFSA